jgi:hypothetical protein
MKRRRSRTRTTPGSTAQQQLEDLKLATQDMALSQESAALAVQEAHRPAGCGDR